MKKLATRKDVDFLVTAFYEKAIIDPEISKYFTEIVTQHFELHKIRICDFWDDLIFHGNKYRGNPMLVHLKLHANKNLTPTAFSIWLNLWEQTVKEYFEGPNAEKAITKAKQIGGLMKMKIEKAH